MGQPNLKITKLIQKLLKINLTNNKKCTNQRKVIRTFKKIKMNYNTQV